MTESSPDYDVGLSSALRAPLQGRSRQSYERMMSAAEELLALHGNGDFTISDVSKAGSVSIGSIYNRFESKEALLHAVQLRVLERVNREMTESMAAAIAEYRDLDHLVDRLVRAVADTLYRHARSMSALMQVGSVDSVVSATGKAFYAKSVEAFCQALLDHSDQIKRPDPARAVDTAFRVLYSTIARYLGFGSAMSAAWEGDWSVLKEDLGTMIASFLRTP